MGDVLSSFFQTGSQLLSPGGSGFVSENTRQILRIIFAKLDDDNHAPVSNLEPYLIQISKGENCLSVYNGEGYNILQKAVGYKHVELVRWLMTRGCDANRSVCSLPLHIACLKGYEEIVELLLKHGARIDIETRMCWPGPHNQNCEQRGVNEAGIADKSSDKLQSAICYAIDGDNVEILDMLMQQGEDNWFPWQQKRPLLHLACERGAWNCFKFLVSQRSLEINQCYDECYPIHQAAVHPIRFLELLLQCGADATVRTATQQTTLLHVVFLLGKKSADETLATVKLLLDHGLRDLINEADSLGNTPLHALIIRYSLEESRYGYDSDPPPWNKWDMLLILQYLIQNGASPSINRPGNSALACVLRHVRDWEFRYDLLVMLLQQFNGNPNVIGRDGSVPLMVCLVPLINKDPLHHLTHTMKVFYLNCVRLLCKHGANPNCSSRTNLTPLHVLIFTASEYIMLNRTEEKANAFAFIQQLLVILLQHGLDPNVRFSQRTQHVLLALMDMVQNARSPSDLDYVYNLSVTLLQYGADPNVNISTTEPMICHSQSSVYLKKPPNTVPYYYVQLITRRDELLLLDSEQHFAKLLWLYYLSMDHRTVYSTLSILVRQSTLVTMKSVLSTLLKRLHTHPRTLKQICRTCIYDSISRKTAQNLNKLPLPSSLKEYVLNWTP
uniref:SOCS box domain-containing protein n=1 Tax=Strigamia maritima TaxID=126957 RepID=T1J3V8_STRMM